MNILNRYILKEALLFFAITLFAFTGILLTVRMLQFANLIVNKGVSMSQIAMIFIAIVPTFLEIAVPMAALLGVMLAFARLSGDSEVVVLRAGGISLFQLVRPVLYFALLVGAFSLYVSIQLRPWGFNTLAQGLFDIARSKSTAGLEQGVFNKLGTLTLYTEKINDQTGALERVLIDDRREKSGRRVVVAKTGIIVSDEKDHRIILHLRDGDIHEIQDKNYILTHFNTNDLVMTPEELYDSDDSRDKKTREMLISELHTILSTYKDALAKKRAEEAAAANGETIKIPLLPAADNNATATPGVMRTPGAITAPNLAQLPALATPAIKEAERVNPAAALPDGIGALSKTDLKRKITRIETEAGRRYSMPYASFILAILGTYLGIQPPRTQRTWGPGLSVLLGLGVFVIYYALLSIGITLAEGGKISPYLGLWVPNLVATLITVYIALKMSSEKWQSIAHGFERILDHWTRIVQRRLRKMEM